jgi:hypothetical protein
VLRLVEAELAATRQPDLRHRAPTLLLDGTQVNASCFKSRHVGDKVVGQKEELSAATVITGVQCDLGGRRAKDEPAAADVHEGQVENVAKEGAIRLGVGTKDDEGAHRDTFSTHPAPC